MKRVRVLCDAPQGLIDCTLELADPATIGEAISQAHALLGRAELAAMSAPTGINGQLRPRSFVPADGDRIEIYRPLPADPRAQRRARAGAGGGTGKRGTGGHGTGGRGTGGRGTGGRGTGGRGTGGRGTGGRGTGGRGTGGR